MKRAGIVGKDIHKLTKPEVPEMGGLSLLISIGTVSSLIEPRIGLVFLLFGIVGIVDDLTALKQSHKVALSLIVASPVMFFDVPPRYVDVFGFPPLISELSTSGSPSVCSGLGKPSEHAGRF